MYKVFNCGHRMEVYCDPQHAATVVAVAAAFGVEAAVVGRVEAVAGASSISIAGQHGTFDYALK